jgi:RNA polymerase sigma factor (TIGR02999 family)
MRITHPSLQAPGQTEAPLKLLIIPLRLNPRRLHDVEERMFRETSTHHGGPPPDERPGLSRLSVDARSMFQSLYPLIHSIASARLRHERSGHTLQPTALVHEAFLRLAASRQQWTDPQEFLAAAAQTIRRVLIDHARTHNSLKRGGGDRRLPVLWAVEPALPMSLDDLLDLDQCLVSLQRLDPRRAQIAELKLFAGLGNDEIATLLNVARSTVASDWTVARAWISRALSQDREVHR